MSHLDFSLNSSFHCQTASIVYPIGTSNSWPFQNKTCQSPSISVKNLAFFHLVSKVCGLVTEGLVEMSSLITFFSHSTSNAAAHHAGSDIQNYIQTLTNSHQFHHSHSSPQRPSLSYTTVFSNWLAFFCSCTLPAPHIQQQV